MIGQLEVCPKCGRKILVERALIGTNHTTLTLVTCWDCLTEEGRSKAIMTYDIPTKE